MKNIYLCLLALAFTSIGFGLPFTGNYNFDSSVDKTIDEVFLTFKRTYVEPTTSATNYSTSGIATTNATLNWARGNGDNVLVVVRQGGAVDSDPISGTSYTANSVFNSGSELGTGNYVVYNGPGTNVNISGLLPNTAYSVAIYEYVTGFSYNTTELTGNFITACDAVLSLPFNEGFEGGAVPPSCWRSFSGVNGLGVSQSWMIEETTTHSGDFAAKINPEPVALGAEDWLVTPAIDLSATSNNQLRFYARDFFATNEGSFYTVRISTTSQTDISSFATLATYNETQLGNSYNLKTVDLTSYNNQTVYIAFVMAQTDGDLWYLDTISITGECATPSTQASNYNTTNINGGAGTATLNWTRGNGDNVLVMMKEGSAVNTDPVVGTAYNANASFGDGDQLGSGNFVVYNGPASSVNVSNLIPNTNYHIAVYEYSNGGNCYNLVQLTGNFFVPCVTYNLPFNEGFEDAVPPSCWTVYRGINGVGTNKDWTSTTDANSGSQAAFVDWEPTFGNLSQDWLVTPAILLPAGANAQLTFFTKDGETFVYGSEYTIRVSTTSQTDRASFDIVQTYTETTLGSTYNQKTINLDAYNNETVYIAFVLEQDDEDSWFIDDISIESVIAPPVGYIYNNAWTPADPSGVSTASDDIQIIAGSTNFTAPTIANNLTINGGATLTIDATASFTASGTIVNDGTLALTSTSTTYSSLITNSISGSGSVSYNRHVNINATVGENDLISAPVTGEAFGPFATNNANIVSDPNNTSSKLFGPFSKTSGTYELYDSVDDASTALEAGVGYRTASTNNGGFTFTGIVNTGVVNSNIVHTPSLNFKEWNLIGNPYPSYLNVGDFLTYEIAPGVTNLDLMLAESAAIYGYDGLASDGWITYNLLTDPETLITPGQGFFVSADPTAVATYDMQFAPSMRRSGATDDFIAGRSVSSVHLKLQASNATSTYNTDFYFNDNSTLGLDRGYDAAAFGTNVSGFGIYSHLVQDNMGVDMTIQSMPISLLNSEVTVPLGLNVTQGQQVTISIAETNLPTNVNVYLEDIVSGSMTLLNTGDYIFTANSNLNVTGRFFLRFSDQTLFSPETSASELQIFATVSPKALFIKGQLASVSTIDLYDIQGRLVFTSYLDGSSTSNKVDVSSLPTGVYIVKLNNSTQQKTQKLILK